MQDLTTLTAPPECRQIRSQSFTHGAAAMTFLTASLFGEGNYYAPPDVLERLEANRQVILRYATPEGALDDGANPNGSVHAIAGLCNERRNVVGMMPHPERACEPALGSTDGLVILQSVVSAFTKTQGMQAVS